jgi:hypothetical protein
MQQEKPKIKRAVRTVSIGGKVETVRYWVCTGEGVSEAGLSPEMAYRGWAARRHLLKLHPFPF